MEKKDYTNASWQGLASRLQRKLDDFGVQLPDKDRHLLGDFEVLDGRCQTLPELIEGLAVIPVKAEAWEALGDRVARLLAEAETLKREASRIQPPLRRLLSQICAVRSPRKHLERVSRARIAPLKK